MPVSAIKRSPYDRAYYSVPDKFNMNHFRKFVSLYNYVVMQGNIPHDAVEVRNASDDDMAILFEVSDNIPDRLCPTEFEYLKRLLKQIKDSEWEIGINIYQMTQLNKLYKTMKK